MQPAEFGLGRQTPHPQPRFGIQSRHERRHGFLRRQTSLHVRDEGLLNVLPNRFVCPNGSLKKTEDFSVVVVISADRVQSIDSRRDELCGWATDAEQEVETTPIKAGDRGGPEDRDQSLGFRVARTRLSSPGTGKSGA